MVGQADAAFKILKEIDPKQFMNGSDRARQKAHYVIPQRLLGLWDEYLLGCMAINDLPRAEKGMAEFNAIRKKNFDGAPGATYSSLVFRAPALFYMTVLYIKAGQDDKVTAILSDKTFAHSARIYLLCAAAQLGWDANRRTQARKWADMAIKLERVNMTKTQIKAASKQTFLTQVYMRRDTKTLANMIKKDWGGNLTRIHLTAMSELGMNKEAMELVRQFDMTESADLIHELRQSLLDDNMLNDARELIIKNRKLNRPRPGSPPSSWSSHTKQCESLARQYVKKRDFTHAEWMLELKNDKNPTITGNHRIALRMEMAIDCIIKGKYAQAESILKKHHAETQASTVNPRDPSFVHMDPASYIAKELRVLSRDNRKTPTYPGTLLSKGPWVQMHIAFRLATSAPPQTADKWLARLTDVKEQICFNLGRHHGQWTKTHNKPDMTVLWTGP
ncbi:MAG: hypothetical protein HN350_21300 [Phycisphaerales bacterium]|nr:hypothetical protein [Phycisphaerales bacterium]